MVRCKLVSLLTISIVACCLVFLFSNCTSNTQDKSLYTSDILNTSGESFEIKDSQNRVLKFNSPVKSIIATAPCDVEVLAKLGCQNKIIARGDYCNYPDSVNNIENVGSGITLSIERIINLSPDVVILNQMSQTSSQLSSLEAAGIKVFCTNPNTLDDIYKNIINLGYISGCVEESQNLTFQMQDTVSNLVNLNNENKSVYIEVYDINGSYWAAGKNTFLDDICNKLSLTNIFSNVEGWAQISQEQVVAKNPDYIITLAYSTYEQEQLNTAIDKVVSRNGWSNIAAVKNKSILALDSNYATIPGPRVVDTAKSIADLLNS